MIQEVLESAANSLATLGKWFHRQRIGLWSRKFITALPDRELKLPLDSSIVDEGWYGFVAKSPSEIVFSVKGSGQFLKAMIKEGSYYIWEYRPYTSAEYRGDINRWAGLLYALDGIALRDPSIHKLPPWLYTKVPRNAAEFAASLLFHMWMPYASLAACHHRAGKGPTFAIGQKEWSFYRLFCPCCNNQCLGSRLRGTHHIDTFLGGRRVYRDGILLSCDAGHDIAVVTDDIWQGFED